MSEPWRDPETWLSRTEIRDLADCPEPECGAAAGQKCRGAQRRRTGQRGIRETNHASRVRAAYRIARSREEVL